MVFGNFAGMGAPVVKAAYDILSIQVLEGDEPVKGLQLILKAGEEFDEDIDFDGPTDSKGIAKYEIAGDEIGTFYVQPAEDSGYTMAAETLEVEFGRNGIEKVGKYDYNGKTETILVESSGSGQTKKPDINTANFSLKEADRDGQTVTLTAKGTNLNGLAGKVYYQLWYLIESNAEFEIGRVQTASAKGSDDEQTFNVVLPAASECPKAVAWKLRVNTTGENKDWVSTNTISISKDSITGEIAALKVAMEEKKFLSEEDYTKKSWRVYSEAMNAAQTLYEDIEATNAKCRTALQAIDKAKAGLVLIKDLAKAETKAALKAAVNEAANLSAADYTTESWKRYSEAIETGKILVAEEDATEVQCQAVIKQINTAKASLVKQETSKKKVKVSKITISGSSKNIAIGKKIKLTAKVSPANATNKAVKWKSSNKKYATVDAKGNVTVKKAGAGKTVTITATAADGSGKKASYKIKIMKNAVKSISLKANKSVKAGRSLKVKATVKTTGKNTNKTLKWTSSNTKYATVSAKGVVKTKKAGKNKKVKITAAATDGSNKKKTITIKIK